MSNEEKEKYYKKYLKYRKKYINSKQEGGLIGRNINQNIIESIGFEFESLYLQPYVFVENHEIFFPDERYSSDFFKKYSLDKLYAKKNIEVINNVKNKFIMNVSSEYSREKPVYDLCKNIKRIDDKFRPKSFLSTDLLNKFYLKKTSDETVIEQVTNIEKHRDMDDMEDMDEWLNVCYKSNTEFTFTYPTIDKSNNTIYEHFHNSIHYLNDYFTKYCDSSEYSLNLIVYDKSDKSNVSDNVIIDRTTFYKQKFTTGNRLAYVIINNEELFDKDIKGKDYIPTIEDIKWDMHMTLGVKLENVDKLLKYLSYYEENKLTNIIVFDSCHDANTLIEIFKLYVNSIAMYTRVTFTDNIYEQLRGLIVLLAYYCNSFTLNIALDNKNEFIKYGYSFMLRNRFEKFINYFKGINESIVGYFLNFIHKVRFENERIFRIVADKKLNFNLEQIINKYGCKITPSKRAICELSKIIGNQYPLESYTSAINNISNLLKSLYALFNDEKCFLYETLIYSTTEINMNNDIVFIEYRGFRIDNFGNNIHTLENYSKMADTFLAKDDDVLPTDREILIKSKYITKLKSPKSSEYIFLLDNKIYKRKKELENKYINIFYKL